MPARPARTPFVLLLCTLLGGGLLSLLMLNTVLAQDAFAVHDLEAAKARLDARAAALEQQLAEETAPQRLARRAAALGLVANENPAFIRQADKRVLGAPAPAPAANGRAGSPGPVPGLAPPLLSSFTPALVSEGPDASAERLWVATAGTRPSPVAASPAPAAAAAGAKAHAAKTHAAKAQATRASAAGARAATAPAAQAQAARTQAARAQAARAQAAKAQAAKARAAMPAVPPRAQEPQ